MKINLKRGVQLEPSLSEKIGATVIILLCSFFIVGIIYEANMEIMHMLPVWIFLALFISYKERKAIFKNDLIIVRTIIPKLYYKEIHKTEIELIEIAMNIKGCDSLSFFLKRSGKKIYLGCVGSYSDIENNLKPFLKEHLPNTRIIET